MVQEKAYLQRQCHVGPRCSHTFKTGGEVYFQGICQSTFAWLSSSMIFGTKLRPRFRSRGLNLAGQSMGFGFASFLLGDYSSIQQNTPADYRLGKITMGGCSLQDSWKVNRKLTLDYGLRWDYGTLRLKIRSAMSWSFGEATCRRTHRRADAWEEHPWSHMRLQLRDDLSLRRRTARGPRLSSHTQ